MAEQYKKASLVICRAGATTLAELTAMGRASILVPYPYAAHNHQEHNARVLVEADAATMILDREINGEAVARIIREMMAQPEKLLRQSKNSYRLGQRDATHRVRNLCLELMKSAA
jgi:UDP-N-acetylglucosamine--N-acetylmuramyl-(pentapeptide) pyrophosphoryl-undecaprenol N-acetylglucosamine transferase